MCLVVAVRGVGHRLVVAAVLGQALGLGDARKATVTARGPRHTAHVCKGKQLGRQSFYNTINDENKTQLYQKRCVVAGFMAPANLSDIALGLHVVKWKLQLQLCQ